MPRRKTNELLAGTLVVAALATLVGIVLWLGASEWLKPRVQEAWFYAPESAGMLGLAPGSAVQIGDDRVGSVSRVEYRPQEARVYYTVVIEKKGAQVHADGKARVSSAMLGDSSLVVYSRGSSDRPLATAEHPIEIEGGLVQAMADLADLAGQFKKMGEVLMRDLDADRPQSLLAKVHGTAGFLLNASGDIAKVVSLVQAQAPSLVNKVQVSADDVNAVTGSLRRQSDPREKDSLVAKVHASADDVNAMSADARVRVKNTLASMEHAAGKIDEYTTKDVGEMLLKLRKANDEILNVATNLSDVVAQVRQTVVLHRSDIDAFVSNLTQVSADLKATAQEVRRNPWRLLYKPTEKETQSANIQEAARAFAVGAEQLDAAVARLESLAKANPQGVAAGDPQVQALRKDLQQTFEKFSVAEKALWKELAK